MIASSIGMSMLRRRACKCTGGEIRMSGSRFQNSSVYPEYNGSSDSLTAPAVSGRLEHQPLWSLCVRVRLVNGWQQACGVHLPGSFRRPSGSTYSCLLSTDGEQVRPHLQLALLRLSQSSPVETLLSMKFSVSVRSSDNDKDPRRTRWAHLISWTLQSATWEIWPGRLFSIKQNLACSARWWVRHPRRSGTQSVRWTLAGLQMEPHCIRAGHSHHHAIARSQCRSAQARKNDEVCAVRGSAITEFLWGRWPWCDWLAPPFLDSAALKGRWESFCFCSGKDLSEAPMLSTAVESVPAGQCSEYAKAKEERTWTWPTTNSP